ncbi:hypothetical protein [Azospirillum thermophilum]|uniref:Uncharacterized protein n=1 Tax=Azospirillum thermophilum TaxID=2202148 RepID=A0A2S2CY49_9PROT|nr:hypothetical protein [Azospirillum thermophilum]AWK89442.1 hypothetical protein DEW08_25780 [Azospirillum thermophilum]
MTIHLSALGWIDEAPFGNRLRWHYPMEEVTAEGRYVGLPKTLVVERAPLDSRDLYRTRETSLAYPSDWWDRLGDVAVAGFLPPFAHALPGPVQAVSFLWEGSAGRILIRDRTTGSAAFDRTVSNGDIVYAEGTGLDTVLVFAVWGTLRNLRVLDLFRDRGLRFEPIAEIAVEASFGVGLGSVAPRYDQPPTLSSGEWEELRQAAAEAMTATPAAAPAGEPTAWGRLALLLGLRWEFALLAGFAFFDGPRRDRSELDRLSDDILAKPPAGMVAYRVVDREGSGGISNLVVCPPWTATPLSPPAPPHYSGAEVRLRERRSPLPGGFDLAAHASLKAFSPVMEVEEEYRVRATLSWQQADPQAIGVEVEEAVSASPATGAPGRRTSFLSRTRRPGAPVLQGSVSRNPDVVFPDVTLQARVRAQDGWDRVSDFSGWGPAVNPVLVHEPAPPPLETARHDAGTTRIRRAAGREGIADWQPDPLVARAGGQVFVYRRAASPRTADVTVGMPVEMAPGRYRVAVSGAAGLGDFVGGTLSAGAFTEAVVAAGPSSVDLAVSAGGLPDKAATAELFAPGPARLSQSPTHPSLWTKVAAFPAKGLPEELAFADPLPPTPGLAIEAYTVRLSYLGRLGPAGTVVCAIRQPVVPPVPPPFEVQVLGIDFYQRTMLKLRFTTPPGGGRFTVWWAPGTLGAAELAKRGSPGSYGAQEAAGGLVLYDVLPLPLPLRIDGRVTVGVQRTGADGTRSDFVTLPVTLPALVP